MQKSYGQELLQGEQNRDLLHQERQDMQERGENITDFEI